jgi:hypothetical protein
MTSPRLLGRDDVVSAMEAAGYPMYGAPKLVRITRTAKEPVRLRRAIVILAAGWHEELKP